MKTSKAKQQILSLTSDNLQDGIISMVHKHNERVAVFCDLIKVLTEDDTRLQDTDTHLVALADVLKELTEKCDSEIEKSGIDIQEQAENIYRLEGAK